MKRFHPLSDLSSILLLMICCSSANILWTNQAAAQIAVAGDTVFTMEGEPLIDGVVLIRDGKIEQTGTRSSVAIPDHYELYEAEIVTPGLIDARSVVGLSGYYNQEYDQDQLEYSHAVQPELRAFDAYNAREKLVGFLRENGITTIHTGHAPGAVISGQTMIVKTAGQTVEEVIIDSTTALAITLGSVVRTHFDTPGTRSKGIAMLRQELIKAGEYAERRNNEDPDRRPDRDLGLDALVSMLEGEIFALVTAQRAHDIMTALRLQNEFGFPMLLEGAAEAYLLIDELVKAEVPVIIHPTMTRLRGDTENAAFDTAGRLSNAGVPVLFQSGYEPYVPKTRVVLFETAIAVQHGLDRMDALRSLTIDAARILNIDNRTGSLRQGKDADLVLFNGDPFEYTTRPTHVIIDGRPVYEYNAESL